MYIKKLLFILVMTFIFTSCQDITNKECSLTNSCVSDEISEHENKEDTPTAEEHDHQGVEVNENQNIHFKTNIKFLNFGEEDKAKVRKALKELVYVIKSDEFKNEVLYHTYKGEETFVDNQGLSNKEIYQKILKGAEDLLPVHDNEMDLELKLYYKNNGVIGYTYPSKLQINMNTKFFNRFETDEVAGNLMHEWLHKLGFKHSSRRTASRPYSVPYAVGYLVEELIVQMRNQNRL